jgi:hypothetical protein
MASENNDKKTALKTREEYLFEFEKKLLATISDLQKAVDHQLVYAFGLAFLMCIIAIGTVGEFIILGVKLNASRDLLLCFVSISLAAIYSLISFKLHTMSVLYEAINTNGFDLLKINPDARPIIIVDMRLFSYGTSGLVLGLSHRLLNSGKFSIVQGELKANWRDRLRVGITCALFLTPLVISCLSVFYALLSATPSWREWTTWSMLLPGASVLILATAAVWTWRVSWQLVVTYIKVHNLNIITGKGAMAISRATLSGSGTVNSGG